jgi:hypothetical protein
MVLLSGLAAVLATISVSPATQLTNALALVALLLQVHIALLMLLLFAQAAVLDTT